MGTVVVAVRSKRAIGIDLSQDLPYYSKDPITGEVFAWTSAVQERVLDESVLPMLQADPRLEVRVLDARTQAAKRAEYAFAADEAAKAAEAEAAKKRAYANALMTEAQAALDALGSEPEPEPEAPKATPYTDQLLAALPDNVRDEVQKQRIDISTVREQMQKNRTLLATEVASPKPGGALAAAKAQAAGESPKTKSKSGAGK